MRTHHLGRPEVTEHRAEIDLAIKSLLNAGIYCVGQEKRVSGIKEIEGILSKKGCLVSSSQTGQPQLQARLKDVSAQSSSSIGIYVQ